MFEESFVPSDSACVYMIPSVYIYILYVYASMHYVIIICYMCVVYVYVNLLDGTYHGHSACACTGAGQRYIVSCVVLRCVCCYSTTCVFLTVFTHICVYIYVYYTGFLIVIVRHSQLVMRIEVCVRRERRKTNKHNKTPNPLALPWSRVFLVISRLRRGEIR